MKNLTVIREYSQTLFVFLLVFYFILVQIFYIWKIKVNKTKKKKISKKYLQPSNTHAEWCSGAATTIAYKIVWWPLLCCLIYTRYGMSSSFCVLCVSVCLANKFSGHQQSKNCNIWTWTRYNVADCSQQQQPNLSTTFFFVHLVRKIVSAELHTTHTIRFVYFYFPSKKIYVQHQTHTVTVSLLFAYGHIAHDSHNSVYTKRIHLQKKKNPKRRKKYVCGV